MALLDGIPLFVVLPLGAALLVLITWLALSKGSSRAVKRAALAALIVIGLSVILCLIMILSEDAVAVSVSRSPISEPVQPVSPPSNSLLVFLIFLLAFLGVIIFLALRREKR